MKIQHYIDRLENRKKQKQVDENIKNICARYKRDEAQRFINKLGIFSN